MKNVLHIILANSVEIAAAIVVILLQRYLLGLGSFQADKRWLESQAWYQYLVRLRFYRGDEMFHQWRGTHLLESALN